MANLDEPVFNNVFAVGLREMQAARPTAKFWMWKRGGFVRFNLHYGQKLTYRFYERTDEGHSWEAFTLRYELADDGKTLVVMNEWGSGGSDCDGPISECGTAFCPIAYLGKSAAYVPEGEPPPLDTHNRPIRLADWRKYRPNVVHDAYAEAAGY